MDQKELCRRFILDDRLTTTKKQVSPFTGEKVKKGTREYDDTLVKCKDLSYKETVKKTKKTQIPATTEAVLPLIASVMTQQERRKFLSATPVVGVARKTIENLEANRDMELLSIPNSKFLKYVYPKYPKRINFKSIPEDFILPNESYDIFLKYFKKGVPIPKDIEEYFDNPSDPKFYQKLIRVATQQRIKIPDFIFSAMENQINHQSMIDYYYNILKKSIPEQLIIVEEVKRPMTVLTNQIIKDNILFWKLINNLGTISPKNIESLIKKYKDEEKLIILYFLIHPKDAKLKKYKNELKTKISTFDPQKVEKIIEILKENDYPSDEHLEDLAKLYLSMILQQTPDESANKTLLDLLVTVKNNELIQELYFVWKNIFPHHLKEIKDHPKLYVNLLGDIYMNGDWSDFELLKFFLDELGEDKKLVQRFLHYLDEFYNLDKNNIIDIVGSNKNQLTKVSQEEIYSME